MAQYFISPSDFFVIYIFERLERGMRGWRRFKYKDKCTGFTVRAKAVASRVFAVMTPAAFTVLGYDKQTLSAFLFSLSKLVIRFFVYSKFSLSLMMMTRYIKN